MKKTKIDGVIHVNAYLVLSRAVEEGVRYGLSRAYKHTETPTREAMEEEVAQAVTTELCEVLRFEE